MLRLILVALFVQNSCQYLENKQQANAKLSAKQRETGVIYEIND